ncbi:MAG: 1-acyl-sn-glycerol-3-phosphate acyltransferase [Anaerolineales bacterium]|nr:1-acyl-sn-glycerol-3-phosphate acyltransferase [Anaerolineales bacterium]
MSDQTVPISFLRQTLMDEINSAFGLPKEGLIRRIINPLYWLPADRFAQLGVKFDQMVAELGFCEAARWVLPRFVQDTFVAGEDQIPAQGPLLITSNHPGTVDTLAISANLHRDDIKIIATGIPFIDHLPFTRQHIIFVTRNIQERMLAIRASIRHLQEGGTLLIFPSGGLDPDPAVLPGAEEALASWSPSLEIILKKVPQTKILLTIVSGVLSQTILQNPLIRLRKGFRERQKLAEFLQVIQQLISYNNFNLKPKISFRMLPSPNDLQAANWSRSYLQSIIAKSQQLLQTHLNTPLSPNSRKQDF